MKVLTAEQMRKIDELTTSVAGVPSLILMENAGIQLLRTLDEQFDSLEQQRIAVVSGKGNNGGDGFVLARQLAQRGIYADVFLLARRQEVSGDAAVNLNALLGWGIPVFELTEESDWDSIAPTLEVYDIIVDAILGTGIAKPVHGLFARAVEEINQSRAYILSVDIPSGMFSDSVEPSPLCVLSDHTVTFTAPKIAHVLSQDLEAFGRISIASIGTPPHLLDLPDYSVELLIESKVAEDLPPRISSSHKGTYGHVAVIAGSRGKTGAAALASLAALRGGSGLVTVYCPSGVQSVVASHQPEIMTEGFAETDSGTFSDAAIEPVLELLGSRTCGGIGPGLGRGSRVESFARRVVRESAVPLVIDADALNAFEDRSGELRNLQGAPLVLTPHPGEFSRLSGIPVGEILSDPIRTAAEFAETRGVWLVLKNFRTLVATPQGPLFVSPQGNPGMATAGMGDVLTGILTATLGRFWAGGLRDPRDVTRAVCLGVYLHGLAGDIASEWSGQDALVAGDVIDALGDAFQQLLEGLSEA